MKILFITLSNIGDVILALPVLDALRQNFPEGRITCLVGQRPKEIFENNPNIDELIIYDKDSRLPQKFALFKRLKKERFDIIVDLRNSFLGAILPARHKTSPFLVIPRHIRHMKERHLYKLQIANCKLQIAKVLDIRKTSLYIKPEDEEYINGIFRENNITADDKIIVISAGARSHIKRWPQDKFVELVLALVEEFKAKVILVGDKDDAPIAKYITEHSPYPLLDLSAKTNIMELACVLKSAGCVITNDSAVLHLASYLNRPVVAIFGPTSELKYGPWSENSAVVKKDICCRPCQEAQCKFGTLRCMQLIKVEDVLRGVRNILSRSRKPEARSQENDYKRILIVRTDKIGDVVLSTPVIKAFRNSYPHAYIAMMASPYTKDILEGNPYLDEVIIYDKDGKHKSWPRSLKFSRNLRKRRFDLAVILHPTNRVHLVTFFARIPKRVGYNRKLGFLLTDRIAHTKQTGEKHELEYNLDLARYLGIEPEDKNTFIPIKAESEKYIDELFREQGINKSDKLLGIHPSASCLSRIWPNARFAEVADRLIKKYGFKILIVAGPKDIKFAEDVIKHMHQPAINLAARTSLSQLASLLKRCRLFISNDSGPVHIASAVGTPVISIFGRNQKGLSPERWGPQGKNNRILHKKVGCIECLAHNCVKEFACLKAITVEDVLSAADDIIEGTGSVEAKKGLSPKGTDPTRMKGACP